LSALRHKRLLLYRKSRNALCIKADIHYLLLLLIAIFGVLFSVIIGQSLKAAIANIKKIAKNPKLKNIVARKTMQQGFIASNTIPILFIVLWSLLIIIHLATQHCKL